MLHKAVYHLFIRLTQKGGTLLDILDILDTCLQQFLRGGITIFFIFIYYFLFDFI